MDMGRTGNPISIPLRFDRLSSHVSITRNQYSLIGGNPGTGKSSFAHQVFALDAYDWVMANKDETDVKLRVFIYSLERAEEFYIAKWVCFRIYQKYGILVHPRLVLGMVPKTRMPDQMYDLIKEEREYFEEMSDMITMISDVTSVAKIDRDLTTWANENGTYATVPDPVSGEPRKVYRPNDDGLITLSLIDHIGRVKTLSGGKKVTVDTMSEVLCKHRDMHGFSSAVVCQFNRNIGDINRRKLVNFLPEEQDFKESGNMFEDCDAAYALFNPRKFGIEEMFGYDLGDFQSDHGENRFRIVTVLKNSLGADLLNVPLNFIGETGEFKELKHSTDMSAEDKHWAANPAKQTMTGQVIPYVPPTSSTMNFSL
jgi:hypothetical protein